MRKAQDTVVPDRTIADALAERLGEAVGAQQAMAHRMGVSAANVSRWVGGNGVDGEHFEALRAELGVSWEQFGLLLVATGLAAARRRATKSRRGPAEATAAAQADTLARELAETLGEDAEPVAPPARSRRGGRG